MYRVRLAKRSERGLRAVRLGDPRGHRRIVAAIRGLADNPRPVRSTRLMAFDPPAWRIRVGDYRVVYEIHDGNVVVVDVSVAPRAEVYR